MAARLARKLWTRVLTGGLFWCGAAAALNWLPPGTRNAAAQLLAIAVAAFGWRQGAWAGALHGAAAATAVALLVEPIRAPYLIASGSSNVLGAITLMVLGGATGLLSDRVRSYLERRRESEERYVLAARGANDGLWDWDLRTDRVYYSERWSEILGYNPGEVSGRPEDWLDRIHPADVGDVRVQVREHIQGHTPRYENEHRIRCQDGSWTWVLTRGVCTRDEDGQPRRMTGWLTDISERKHAEERLRHYAFHDALTGLPNRALFMDRVEHAMARQRRHPDHKLAVFMLDLDRFKNVNDSLGHLAGDELLCQMARRLENCVRAGDTIARLGGDEFTVLMEEIEDDREVTRMADLLQRTISAPVSLNGQDVVTSSSIGVALGSTEAIEPRALLRDADQAMYRAKRQGKGQHVLFDERVHHDTTQQRLSLETALRSALETGAVHVHYQPIVDLCRGRICGFEAFARWNHPTLGPISPREFVYVAEETGLIHRLGSLVLQEAVSSLAAWNAEYAGDSPFTLGVNASIAELSRDGWLDHLQALVETHSIPLNLLGVEVTEHALMQNTATGHHIFRALREAGVQIYMDDFGTGYSSLSYLHRFPLDALKIDGSFVGQLHEDTGAEEIVRAVVSLGKDLGLRVVAEGVERSEQVRRLRELGCHAAQGFFFGAPTTQAEISALLRSEPSW